MTEAFCISGKDLEECGIKKLIRKHPKALPVKLEWTKEHEKISLVIWWVEPRLK